MDRDKLIKEVGGNMNVAHLVSRVDALLLEPEQDGQLCCRAYVVRLGK